MNLTPLKKSEFEELLWAVGVMKKMSPSLVVVPATDYEGMKAWRIVEKSRRAGCALCGCHLVSINHGTIEPHAANKCHSFETIQKMHLLGLNPYSARVMGVYVRTIEIQRAISRADTIYKMPNDIHFQEFMRECGNQSPIAFITSQPIGRFLDMEKGFQVFDAEKKEMSVQKSLEITHNLSKILNGQKVGDFQSELQKLIEKYIDVKKLHANSRSEKLQVPEAATVSRIEVPEAATVSRIQVPEASTVSRIQVPERRVHNNPDVDPSRILASEYFVSQNPTTATFSGSVPLPERRVHQDIGHFGSLPPTNMNPWAPEALTLRVPEVFHPVRQLVAPNTDPQSLTYFRPVNTTIDYLFR